MSVSRTGQPLPCWYCYQQDHTDVLCMHSKPGASWKALEQEKFGNWRQLSVQVTKEKEVAQHTQNIWHHSFFHEFFCVQLTRQWGIEKIKYSSMLNSEGAYFSLGISLEMCEWIFITILKEIAHLCPVLLRASPMLPHEMAITALVSHLIASANCKTD